MHNNQKLLFLSILFCTIIKNSVSGRLILLTETLMKSFVCFAAQG